MRHGCQRKHTALPIHLDQEYRDSDLARRNSQVEEKDSDPSVFEERTQGARCGHDLDVVSTAV